MTTMSQNLKSYLDLIRIATVKKKTALSNGSIYLHVKQGLLPDSIRIGEKAVAWVEGEIDAVVKARIAGKSDAEIRELVAKLIADRAALV